jgi:hypothetical protein
MMLGLTAAAAAHASPHAGVDGQLYRPAMDPRGSFALEGAGSIGRGVFALKLDAGYWQSPLRVAVPGIGSPDGADPVLDFVFTCELAVALGLSERLTVGFEAGLYRTDTAAGYGERGRYSPAGNTASTGLISLRPLSNIDPSGGFEPQGRSGPLDARLSLKYQLADAARWRLAVLFAARLPFGEDEMFLGDQSFVAEPRLATELMVTPRVRLLGNLGLLLRRRTALEAYDASAGQTAGDAQVVLDVGSEATGGLAAVAELGRHLAVSAEALAFLPLPEQLSIGRCERDSGVSCRQLTAMDYHGDAGYGDPAAYALAGLHWRLADVEIGLSAGRGLAGARGGELQVVSSLRWTPRGRTPGRGAGLGLSRRRCAPGEPRCAQLDADGDGVDDRHDRCPLEAEDLDELDDEDGCRDGDDDRDRIDDRADECPLAAEDRDGFRDDDGCPEPDNDGDGVGDDSDLCPLLPARGQSADGCPEPQGVPEEAR